MSDKGLDAFEAWIEERFGPEQSGVSPEVYEWLWDTWCAACEHCAQIAERTWEGEDGGGGDDGFRDSGTPVYGENTARVIRREIYDEPR